MDEPRSPAEHLLVNLFHTEGPSLVRLARLYVDDRNAAEDLVQEAFLRLARNTARIANDERAPAYLRSIVLNLARDHNRRGLVSLRHHSSPGRGGDSGRDGGSGSSGDAGDMLVRNESSGTVLAAVRALPPRQRDCITLRYFEELGIDAISTTLNISRNSVKTHLRRAMHTLAERLDKS